MELSELVKARQSCRSFQPDCVISQDNMQAILSAIQLAPSARNSQPYRVCVITDKAKLAEAVTACQYLGGNPFLSNCSAMLVFVLDKKNLVDRAAQLLMCDMRPYDVGIAIAHAVLQAQERGIDSCIIGWIHEKRMKKALDIGDKEELGLAIALGYQTEGYPLRPKKRKDADQLFIMK